MSLTYSQSRAIDITQKTVSSFSVLGEFLVIVTFLSSSKFRKPFNRLVFYATFGNMFSNMATLIGQSAIRLGLRTPLCQFQAFLIQWLMPADALWIFAMALNVWLTFFHHWDAAKLKALEWKYLLFCYGCPFIPAITFIFIDNHDRGRVYGNAVIWCWISIKWDFLRIAVFYGPVWALILLIFAIYSRVGLAIWRRRRRIESAGKRMQQTLEKDQRDDNLPSNEIRVVDEVTVTREDSAGDDQNAPSPNPSSNLRPHGPHSRARAVFSGHGRRRKSSNRSTSSQTNRATIRYFKCALMFFIALIIVWVPSTINRIWTLIYPEDVIFGLQFAAALVLPLQGFCNSFVYFATSTNACKSLWRDLIKRRHLPKSATGAGVLSPNQRPHFGRYDSGAGLNVSASTTIAESEGENSAESEADSLGQI